MRFCKTKVAKKEFYGAKIQKRKQYCDNNVDKIGFTKLIETKNNFKYFITYLDEVVRPLALILPKMSRYVKSFMDKDGDKNKNKNKKLMSLRT